MKDGAALRVALGAALCATTGCIATPANGYEVRDREQPIPFSGYHPYAGATVSVRAWDFTARRWEAIAPPVTTSETPIADGWWEDPLYGWSAGRHVLHREYWEAGRCAGWRARVSGRTTVGGRSYGMYSMDLEKNAEGCTSENRNNDDWVRNCSAPESEIRTRDYADRARPLEVDFTPIPSPDASCTNLVFRWSHPRGEWSEVGATYSAGGSSRSMRCVTTSETRDTTYGRCTLTLGSVDAVRRTVEALRTSSANIQVSARDEDCRRRLVARASETVRASRYDYYWSRWTGIHDQCAAPPEPEPEPDPRTHTLGCLCASAYDTVTATVSACIDVSGGSSAVITGAGFMCEYAENDVEAAIFELFDRRIDVSCVLDSISAPGGSCGRPGTSSFVSIE